MASYLKADCKFLTAVLESFLMILTSSSHKHEGLSAHTWRRSRERLQASAGRMPRRPGIV